MKSCISSRVLLLGVVLSSSIAVAIATASEVDANLKTYQKVSGVSGKYPALARIPLLI